MITLIGHGYIGNIIAKELNNNNLPFNWVSHKDEFIPSGFIINAAGFTGVPNVDACEIYKQETIEGNVLFPLKVEENSKGYPVIHISSGCVYNGYKDGGWTEEDEPNFNFSNGSFYSGSKVLEQELLKPFMNKSYLFRIRMPFGEQVDKKNYLTKLETYEKLAYFKNSLTNIEDLAKVVIYFVQNSPETGIYNVCNPGSVTTKEVTDKLGIKSVSWFQHGEFEKVIKTPRSNCVLNVDKLLKVYPIPPILDSLEKTIKNYNKNK